MKRTLFALSFLAASALSNGAEPVYSWEWTAGGAQITASGWHNDFTYTEGNDYASFTSSNNPWNASISGISNSFTISFDLKNLSTQNSNWNSILSLYSNNTTSGNGNSLQLQFNSSGALMLYNKVGGETSFGGANTGNTSSINTGLTSADLQRNTWTSFSIISDLDSNTLSVYVNGSLAGSITEWNPQSPALTGAQFGSAFGGGGHALLGSIDINNIKFYNEVVLTVPEPATTSLSLMGLAALMMRRRRA